MVVYNKRVSNLYDIIVGVTPDLVVGCRRRFLFELAGTIGRSPNLAASLGLGF